MKQQHFLPNEVFPFVPIFVSCRILFNTPAVIYFCAHKESLRDFRTQKFTSAGERVVTLSHNALMMSVALFFRYVTTAFGEELLYYIGCESWSFALTGTLS